MEFLEYELLNVGWVIWFLLLYGALLVTFIYKEKKSAGKLINSLKLAKSEEEFCQITNTYIKKHPLSLYNSTLRLKMIPHLLSIGDKQSVKTTLSKIRLVDLYQQLNEYIIYVLFLLKENGYKSEFDAFMVSASKALPNEYKDLLLFFNSDCVDLNLLHETYDNVYLESIRCFYKIKIESGNNNFETDIEHLLNLSEKVGDKVYYKLLVKNGYIL